MPELEAEDAERLLSRPAALVPGQVTRRRFLAGSLVTAGAMGAIPGWFDGVAAAAAPVAADDGILIVLQLNGANDGLNTVVPIGDSTYLTRRGSLAIKNPLPLDANFGLHPKMPKLKARYDAGHVAIVHGVGQATADDLSHFSSMASWMAGTAGPSRTTGWLGRWLDGVPGSEVGLHAVTVGASIPLHLIGQKAVVTSVGTDGHLFGSDHSQAYMDPVYDTLAAFASAPTGKGPWADRLASAGAESLRTANELNPVFIPELPDRTLSSRLTVAARLINANVGTRVFHVTHGAFDTHEYQGYKQERLLGDLDQAIDAFYQALSPTWSPRVTILTWSEFGRRVAVNGSYGTDHGTSSMQFVIGDNVKGGMHGQAPRLDDTDSRGNLRVHVDHRSVQASVLSRWLDADATQILGGTYEELDLFTTGPRGTASSPRPEIKAKPGLAFRGVRGSATARGAR